jgi:hypothetical protein
MTSSKDTDKKPRHGLRRWPVWIGLAAASTVVALLIGAGALALAARSAMANSSRIVTAAAPAAPRDSPYPLGADHAVAIRDHGIPQAFTILFYEEDGAPVRAETWSYYDQGLEVDFVDGEVQGERAISMATGEVIPVPYRPDQFAAFMTLSEVLASAQIDRYLVMPLEDELLEGGEIYYADEIMFGLKDGRLRYVQVLALEGEE